MRVTVKTLDSLTKTFTVPDESSVKEFKEHIASDVNVSADRQRLIFKGKVLKDETKLSECGVDGCVIHLVERKPPSQDEQGGSSSSNTSSSANAGTGGANVTPNLTMEAFQLPVDVMGVSQQIIQSLVNQLGADSAHANISTSASDDGSSLNVHINLQTTSQPGTLVNQRINRARRFLRDATRSLNRMEGEGILPSSASADSSSPSSDGQTSSTQTASSQDGSLPPASNSPLTLAQVLRETSEFTSSMQTAIDRYIFLLESNSAENLAPSDDTLPDRIAETWHNLSHALHALSDLTFNFRSAEPRTVSLLSPLSPHGVPNVPLISSLLGAQQPPFAGVRPAPQPRQTPPESEEAQSQANPLRSNQNVRIRVDPQGGVAITSIIASRGRPGAPTQNAQATQGVQTTTTTSGTRHSGDNSNGSRETFSSSFGNQRSSVSSNDTNAGAGAETGGSGTEASTTGQNPPAPPGSRTTRIIVDDFIALVSSIAPSSFTPSAPSSSSVPASARQGQGAGPGVGQAGMAGPRFQLVNPAPPTTSPNHPDPSLPCQSFHFGPQATQPPQGRSQQETRREPARENSGQSAAAGASSAAAGSSPTEQQPGGQTSGQRESASGGAQQSRDESPFQSLFGLLSGLQGGSGAPFGSAAFLQNAFQSGQGTGARRQETAENTDHRRMFSEVMSHLITNLQADENSGTQDSTASRQGSQTLGEIVRGVQDSGSVEFEEDEEGLVNSLLNRLSNVLVMQDLMGIAFGSPDPFTAMRPTLVEFVNTDLLQGREPTSENLEKATEEFVNEIIESISDSLASVPAKEGVDVVASTRSFLKFYLSSAIRLIVNSEGNPSFAVHFQELLKDLAAEFFVLLSMCYQDGIEGVERIIHNKLPQYSFLRYLDPNMRGIIAQMFMRNIRQMHASRMYCEPRLQVYVIKKQEKKAFEVPPTQPPAARASDSQQGEDVDMCSDDSEGFVTPPASIQQDGPEEAGIEAGIEGKDVEWTTIMPQEWVPVIARDIARQRRHPPQAPFSDAYLNGMPAKKRRKVDQRGTAPTEDVLPAALRQAVAAAGVTPKTSMEDLNRAVQQNSDLHRAYRREVHREVKTKLEKDTDYNPERFPKTRDYFDKEYPEK